MDIVLEAADRYVFDKVWATLLPLSASSTSSNATSTFSSVREGATYLAQKQWTYEPATSYFQFVPTQDAWMSSIPRDNTVRQFIELFLIVWLFGVVLYFVCAGLSYIFVFDKETFKHPKFLKNQVKLEINQALSSMPGMALLTAGCFVAEVKGYAKFYDTWDEAPFPLYNILQFPIFLLFTDCLIYFIHRGLHHPLVYRTLHKPHHKWIMPTPFASHAFHPIDGFAQSTPYHLFPFLLPLNKFAYILLFGFVNVWTILIHDGDVWAESAVINGAACHALHHSQNTGNFGQYTTLWDRLGGSYLKPSPEVSEKNVKGGKEN